MLSIPNPCNEDFEQMTPTERGAFCDKCAIDTYDFRKKSNEQILETLTKSQAHLCGRFYEEQIEHFNRYAAYQSNPVKRKWTSVYAAALLASIFAVSCSQAPDELKELSAERKHLAIFKDDLTMMEMENDYVLQKGIEVVPDPPPFEMELPEIAPILDFPSSCSYDYQLEFAGTDSQMVLLNEVRVEGHREYQLGGELINPHRTLGGVPLQSRYEPLERPGFFKRLFSRKNKKKKD